MKGKLRLRWWIRRKWCGSRPRAALWVLRKRPLMYRVGVLHDTVPPPGTLLINTALHLSHDPKITLRDLRFEWQGRMDVGAFVVMDATKDTP